MILCRFNPSCSKSWLVCIKTHLFLRLPGAANCRNRGVKRACVWDWNELELNSYTNRLLSLFSQVSPCGCPLSDLYQLLFPARYSESLKTKAWKHASSISSTYSYLNFAYPNVFDKCFGTHLRLIMPTLPTWETVERNKWAALGKSECLQET